MQTAWQIPLKYLGFWLYNYQTKFWEVLKSKTTSLYSAIHITTLSPFNIFQVVYKALPQFKGLIIYGRSMEKELIKADHLYVVIILSVWDAAVKSYEKYTHYQLPEICS